MKNYELTVLFHPDLEMNLEPALEKVKKLVSANGGKIIKEENEGKKRLAYPIKSQDFAVYYYYEVELPASSPAKITSVLDITDEVIRYLIVTVDERKAKYEEKRQEREETEEEK